jgi:GNAT superfamily N-acetyltransferase
VEKLLAADDLPPGDIKAREALGRFSMSLASAHTADFDQAYALLDAEFGAKGELERKEVLAGYLSRDKGPRGYKLVVARDSDGQIAAVRDCHVSMDQEARIVVVYLSHVLVLPPYRRSGLGSLLREVPAALGRRAIAEAGLRPPVDLLLAAEMEPVAEGATDTITRLLAYGRARFKIVDPRCLPYCQPDYRAHALIDADRARALPLLAVVRWVGHESADEIPHRLAVAFVEHLYRIFAAHCREQDLRRPRAHALDTLAAQGEAIPLLAPPRVPEDREAVLPLARQRVLAYYPASLL